MTPARSVGVFTLLYWALWPVNYDLLASRVSPKQNRYPSFAFLPFFTVLNDFQPSSWHLNLFLSLHKMSFPFTLVFILQHFFLPRPNNYCRDSFPAPFSPAWASPRKTLSVQPYWGGECSFLSCSKLSVLLCSAEA